MKKKYDYLLEKNNKLNAEHKKYSEMVDGSGKSDEKMRLLKNKMAQYGALDANMLDVIAKHENLVNSEDNRALAEMNVTMQAL